MEKHKKDKTDTALNSRTEKLTKVQRNVEKSYQTRWLKMHNSKEKRRQRTKIQRPINYTTTNLWRKVIRQN